MTFYGYFYENIRIWGTGILIKHVWTLFIVLIITIYWKNLIQQFVFLRERGIVLKEQYVTVTVIFLGCVSCKKLTMDSHPLNICSGLKFCYGINFEILKLNSSAEFLPPLTSNCDFQNGVALHEPN